MKNEPSVPLPSNKFEQKPLPKRKAKTKSPLREKNPIVIAYLLFLIIIVVGYAFNFNQLTIASPIAIVGFNIGFLVAIIMPAAIIFKEVA